MMTKSEYQKALREHERNLNAHKLLYLVVNYIEDVGGYSAYDNEFLSAVNKEYQRLVEECDASEKALDAGRASAARWRVATVRLGGAAPGRSRSPDVWAPG